jgi:photosystem II stability/assembly factor-like uncharacterized protein
MLLVAATACKAARPAETASPAVPAQESARQTGPANEASSPTGMVPRTLAAADLKALAWRSIGPANMGGRVADIAFAPGRAKTFFVATGTGGLWTSANAGTTFSPVFDKEATASIGSVVVADAPPEWPGWKDEPAIEETPKADASKKKEDRGKAKIVWVGTGEGNGRNSSSWGRGVYRSTDGGSTFQNVGLPDSHNIPRLAVDPKHPDTCFAAVLGHLWGPNAERGVYRTSDGGKTWTAVLQVDADTGACDVILDPSDPRIVYAAMYMRRRTGWSFQSGGPQGGVYRSDDGGTTWKKLGQEKKVGQGGLPAQTGRIGLDLFAKDPRIVYAVVESDEGGHGLSLGDDQSREGGVFRSEDRGETWTRASDRDPRAFYFSKVRVDPGNDQRVYLLGFGLYISDDGGKHWRADGARKPHGDLHAMAIDPSDPDHILLGTDGGVYASHDGAKTWDYLNQIPLGEFYNIALDLSDPYRVAGGLQDNGSWVGPSGTVRETAGDKPGEPGGGITNQDWDFIFDGDGYHCAFDPTDPNVIYAEAQGGVVARVNLKTAVTRNIRPAPKEGQPRFRFNWNSPFFVSPHVQKGQPTTLYLGGSHVFRLRDGGDRWERLSEDLSARDVEKIQTVGSEAETYGTVVSLAESPLAEGMLWAGTDDGRVHVTRNGGGPDRKGWSDVTPKDVGGRYISRIEPSHHARDTAYLAIDGHRMDDMDPHLYATDDAGGSWRSIVGDLPAGAPVLVVREDRKNPKVLYAGTEFAVHLSIDSGTHWVRMNGGEAGTEGSLPTVAVDDIQQHSRERDLVLGTHGRSIWILDDASPISELSAGVLAKDLHLFDTQPAKPRFFRPNEGAWSERFFKAANPPMGARITYWLREHTDEKVSLSIADGTGKTVRELSGPGRAGMNRVVWDLQPDEAQRLPDRDADVGHKAFVPAGEYRISLTCGKWKASGKVSVLAAADAPGP